MPSTTLRPHPSSCPGAIRHGSDPRDPDSIELCGHTPSRHSTTTAFCDRCHEEHVDLECDLCPKCNAVWGCAGCGRHAGEHEVDGDRYCSICAAGLVRLAMAVTGQLPRVACGRGA